MDVKDTHPSTFFFSPLLFKSPYIHPYLWIAANRCSSSTPSSLPPCDAPPAHSRSLGRTRLHRRDGCATKLHPARLAAVAAILSGAAAAAAAAAATALAAIQEQRSSSNVFIGIKQQRSVDELEHSSRCARGPASWAGHRHQGWARRALVYIGSPGDDLWRRRVPGKVREGGREGGE